MLATLSVLTILLLAALSSASVARLMHGSANPIFVVIPIHSALHALPLLITLLFGAPDYLNHPGLKAAITHPDTHILYCLYISYVGLLLWGMGRLLSPASLAHRGMQTASIPIRSIRFYLLTLLLVAPLILVVFAPDPAIYLDYGPIQREWPHASAETRLFNSYISKLVQLAIVAGGLLLARTRSWLPTLLLVLPFIAMGVWINGKRNSVAFALAFLLYALWARGYLHGKRLLLAALVGLTLLGVFSSYYQTELRFAKQNISKHELDQRIEQALIDFGRTDVLKLALYRELSADEVPILASRGQSLEILISRIPLLNLGPNVKPPTYGEQAMTAARRATPPGGGGITTSIHDEAIANFSWLGVLIAPAILLMVAQLGYVPRDHLLYPLTLFVLLALQAVHFPAWFVAGSLWFVLVILHRIKRRRLPSSRLRVKSMYQPPWIQA